MLVALHLAYQMSSTNFFKSCNQQVIMVSAPQVDMVKMYQI